MQMEQGHLQKIRCRASSNPACGVAQVVQPSVNPYLVYVSAGSIPSPGAKKKLYDDTLPTASRVGDGAPLLSIPAGRAPDDSGKIRTVGTHLPDDPKKIPASTHTPAP